mmetsp:Transcript_14946/g.24478  ORF Transcript_14946/g.24478 Transcript_14946/m.24478 type:complete len:344 (+) Transcript_14946:78-1109(+)
MAMESLEKRWNEWVTSLKKKDETTDKDAQIKSAQIVYVFGPPGTGKSFTGDYMHVMHGYHHVDGDIPFKNVAVKPEYYEMVEKWIVKGDAADHFSELARLTLEAAKEHDKVVLSHATYKNEYRDHFIKKLIEGGASEDNIIIVQLTIDPKVKARGLYHRTKRQVEQGGMSLEDLARTSWEWEFEGELTEEKFIELVIEAEEKDTENVFEDHPKAVMVDISGRDVTHFDNVDKVLGLTRSNELSYESICAKVKPIDEARDKITMANGFFDVIAEIFAKAGNESLAIEEEGEDEKKVEEMKKRRSSIVQCELLVRDISASSLKNSKSGKVLMRRKSLIMTGKIEE